MLEDNDDLVLALRELNNLLEDISSAEGVLEVADITDNMYDLLENIRSYTGY